MSPGTLTAFEHQRIPVGRREGEFWVTEAECATLLSLAEVRPGFCERGFDYVKLAQYCGIASIGNRVLEILPKTEAASGAEHCRGMLVRLLARATETPIAITLNVSQDVIRAPLVEVFISAFLSAVADLVRGGLLVQYQERDEDLQVVRGAIQISQQLTRNANRPDRIACCYDDLSTDNVWNQAVRFGLWTVRPLIHSSVLQARWIELATAFEDASERSFSSAALRQIPFNRLAVRYRTAIAWVRLLSQSLSPSLRAGTAQAPGLLFDMNQLFERAVANTMAERVAPGTIVSAQEPDRVLAHLIGQPDKPVATVRPDIVLRRHGKVVAVGDTKWKRVARGRSGALEPTEEDVYQLVAYAAAYRCDNLALIYPWHSGLVGSTETQLQIASLGDRRPVISIICLDLAGAEPTAIRGGDVPEWTPLVTAGRAA